MELFGKAEVISRNQNEFLKVEIRNSRYHRKPLIG